MIEIGLFLLITICQAVPWYATYGLSEEEVNYLKEKRCFRGTYGIDELSLLTCPFGGSHFVADLPNIPLCLVELADSNEQHRATEIAIQAGGAVLYNQRKFLILAGKDLMPSTDYPAACMSDYLGSALNIIPIPTTPMLPVVRYETPKLDAPNPKIQQVLDSVSTDNIKGVVNSLASYNSRQSLSATAKQAVSYTRERFASFGFNATEQSIQRSGYCNNVVAIRYGTVNRNNYVVVGAHLDCRASNMNDPNQKAPGADDNGTGSASLLELARVINSTNISFANTLYLTLFCGEEQGLYGSDFQAKQFKNHPTIRVIAMYNADMLGFNYQNLSTLGLVSRSSDATTTNECKSVIGEYLPTLNIGSTTACCSDQQSYYAQGFPAVGFFEGATSSVMYPQYHSSDDSPNNPNINYQQVATFAKALYSCALTKAVPN